MEGEQHDRTQRDHAIYSPLSQRCEQREAAYTSLQWVLAMLPRKSIELIVLAVDSVTPKAVRALQSFISAGQWNDERLLQQHWKEVEADLGADNGVLMSVVCARSMAH